MHTFEVWAPAAKTVAVQAGGCLYTMTPEDHGWWSAEVERAKAGTDYGFSLDDGPVMPDPRSPWQPNGVDGLSRLLDHASFAWTDARWQAKPLPSAVIYELHIGTFTPQGTYLAAIEKLDHLLSLGITHVELLPVNEFAGDWGWGYDGVDLFAPHHCYGTPDDLKRLVDACHAKGLAVILDVVYNHLGPAGNYLGKFGPYFTDSYLTPWGPAVNLGEKGAYEVRRFFADNALMWLRDYHFDGLRLDAVHAFQDHSAVHFLEQLSKETEALSAQLGRHLVLIAESDLNDPRVVKSRDAGGYGINAQWSDDLHHALHAVITGEQAGYYEDFGSFEQLATALRSAFVYSGDYSDFRQRRHGRPATNLPGSRFLAYSQNHDQVGNRAMGERLSQLTSLGRQKIAAAVVLTSPFVPMLFQGEEFSASTPFLFFSNHHADLGQQISAGRRKEFAAFGWNPADIPDPQDRESFCRSKLKWHEAAEGAHTEMLAWYQRLIHLRANCPGLTDGDMQRVETEYNEQAGWFVMRREKVQLACNLGEAMQPIPLRAQPAEIISSEEGWQVDKDVIRLPAEAAAVVLVA
jgi:maltooligosyltrehalose trehalohydrolase